MKIGANRLLMVILLVTGALLLLASCAKRSYIDVDYRLPLTAEILPGRSVYVETHDLRSDPEIFNKRAKEKFQHFTGLFSLSLVKPDEPPTVLGAYPLPMLFETAIKQRLQKLGVVFAGGPTANSPVFRININQFRINLVGQKWVADISYEVSLTKDNKQISREAVTGSAERLKVMGSGGAEKVIGEIFTEMINRLDIERLFEQANL